jgi:hypothetical protein
MEENCSGIIEVLPGICLEMLRSTKSLRISGLPPEILAEYLPYTCQKRYRYANRHDHYA